MRSNSWLSASESSEFCVQLCVGLVIPRIVAEVGVVTLSGVLVATEDRSTEDRSTWDDDSDEEEQITRVLLADVELD